MDETLMRALIDPHIDATPDCEGAEGLADDSALADAFRPLTTMPAESASSDLDQVRYRLTKDK